MSNGAIVQIIGIALALVLALRAMRARNLPAAKLVRWGAIWLAIIAAGALAVQYFGIHLR
jgi:hypothetical protein